MKPLRLLLCSLLWLPAMAVELVMLLLAVPANLIGMSAIASGRGHTRIRWKIPPAETWISYHFPLWLWLFDNSEDGVAGPWDGRNTNERRWCEKAKNWPLWRRILSWNLIRNPVSNLRFTRWGVHVDPARVEWLGNSGWPSREGAYLFSWCWARQGWKCGLWIVRPSVKHGTITHRIGHGVAPAPPREVDRHQGFKFQPWRRG